MVLSMLIVLGLRVGDDNQGKLVWEQVACFNLDAVVAQWWELNSVMVFLYWKAEMISTSYA